jgi:hypothetical protein
MDKETAFKAGLVAVLFFGLSLWATSGDDGVDVPTVPFVVPDPPPEPPIPSVEPSDEGSVSRKMIIVHGNAAAFAAARSQWEPKGWVVAWENVQCNNGFCPAATYTIEADGKISQAVSFASARSILEPKQ